MKFNHNGTGRQKNSRCDHCRVFDAGGKCGSDERRLTLRIARIIPQAYFLGEANNSPVFQMAKSILFHLGIALSLVCALPSSASGSTSLVDVDGEVIASFPRAFFDSINPRTAEDMLENTPGFRITGGDGRRGIGQGGVNVLINGARISGKSTDALEVIRRTPADSVSRIDVLDGASLGLSGLTGQVANVIVETTEGAGSWAYRPRFRSRIENRWLNGSVSYSGEWRDHDYQLSFDSASQRAGDFGNELVSSGDGEIFQEREEFRRLDREVPSVSLSLSQNDTPIEYNLNLSAAYRTEEFIFEQFRDTLDEGSPDASRNIDDLRDQLTLEVGGDISFPSLKGRLKLIGLQRFIDTDFSSILRDEPEIGDVTGRDFFSDRQESESVARLEQTWQGDKGRSFELAAELALNVNDAVQSLTTAGGTLLSLPGSTTKVEELRWEGAITHGRKLSSAVDVQVSGAVEYSTITQTGDVAGERSFFRPKGFAAITVRPDEGLEIRARAERRVEQLEFGAFSSSIDLDDDVSAVGNSDLLPQQSWFVSLAFQRNFADDSQATLSIEAEQLTDVVEQIPIGDRETIGNIDEARRLAIEFSGSKYFGILGEKDLRVDWATAWRSSDIEDPFTLEDRRLNGERRWRYRVDFRHDIPNSQFAYGGNIEDFRDNREFRRSQSLLTVRDRPTVELFIEHKDVFGATVRAYVFNVLAYRDEINRQVFEGSRAASNILFIEDRITKFGPIGGLNITGNF